MSPARVLVVDDNEELAENVCEILEVVDEVEIESSVATLGQSAIDLATIKDFDLALIDLHLPDASGTDLIGRIRAGSPHAEVVIITGDATIESAINAVKEGAFAYVLKPFRGDELIETVRRALAQARLFREREHLRRELERSERRHREVLETVPAFVLGFDGEGRIVLWNRWLEEVTGFAREEMLGTPGAHLVGRSGTDRRLPLKRGGYRLVRWQTAVVPADGHETMTYGLGRDVTDEREMLRRTLRAERLAAVGTLAAGLAHEVRNPLNSAQLQLSVLERRIERGKHEPDNLLAVTRVVKDEIKRLDRLVSDFLAFAQPRPLELQRKPVNELVESAAELIRPEADSAGVVVQVELEPNAGAVLVEPERMRQVLLNLVRNALEAMADGGTLSLRTCGPDDLGNVRIEVEDTGPGFGEEAPVFDAFYTTKQGGTGLGLAIVHRIVTAHDGNIRVESRPGRTCFTVLLPDQPGDSTPAPA